ncbi:MAG TPA: hypothetical protein VLB67_01850, partial [Acidimicrobiia bacterium]|nr:hypothetical protein [Acidimicrobiia bacterium]
MRRSVGMLFVLGSVAFLVGVMFPVVQEVFADLDDREAMASAISGSLSEWSLANVLLGIGALVVGVTLWMVTRTVEGATERAVGQAAGV